MRTLQPSSHSVLSLQDRLLGPQFITDPLIIELLGNPLMKRLEHINQYGAFSYVCPKMDTTRLEHSLGVYFLLKSWGAPRAEQVAGLLHDVGHTVFSHVGDWLKNRTENPDYNDEMFEPMIRRSSIPVLLQDYGIPLEAILDKHAFPLLEQQIPELCADRVEYFLRDSFVFGLLDRGEANAVLSSLRTDGTHIYFTDYPVAQMVAERFMDMDRKVWASPESAASYHLLAQAIRIGMREKLIVEQDLYTTDSEVLTLLKESGSAEINEYLALLTPDIIVQLNGGNPPLSPQQGVLIRLKARFIDPLVAIENNGENEKGGISSTINYLRVSELNPEMAQKMNNFAAFYEQPHTLFISPSPRGGIYG